MKINQNSMIGIGDEIVEITTSGDIAVREATDNFAHLLQRVAGGEEITITDRGVPVARIIPIRPASSIERRKLAIQKMDEIAARCRLDGLRIKDLINEGRR